MHNTTWISLLQAVPTAYRNDILIVTNVGMEITLQEILRMEEHYIVIRGRQQGTTDTGRVFFIPYDQINFLCVQKPMKVSDIRTMYGEPPGEADKDDGPLVEMETDKEDPEENLSVIKKDSPSLAIPSSSTPVGAPRLTKTELLARIRSRSGGTTPANTSTD